MRTKGLTLVLSLFFWSGACAPTDSTLPSPPVPASEWSIVANLVAVQTNFARGADVQVKLTIDNNLQPCRWSLIDTTITSAEVARRPSTIVEWTVRDARGAIVSPRATVNPSFMGLRPHELLLLECGRSYGAVVSLGDSSGMWGYELPRGEYSAQATISIRLRTFFRMHPESLDALRAAWNRAAFDPYEWAPDLVLKSNVIKFDVEN